MGRVVYKYELAPPGDVAKIDLPIGSRVMHADAQGERFCLWALVPEALVTTQSRAFVAVGTGWPIDDSEFHYEPVSTFQVGQYVWHVFELMRQYDGREA